jgi:hypothetical protein
MARRVATKAVVDERAVRLLPVMTFVYMPFDFF